MKKGRALLSLLLAAVMAFGLGAAGGTAAFAEGGNPAEAAQEYHFVCVRMSVQYLQYATGYTGEVQPVKDHYVAADYDSYSVRLNADGTGYLFLGDNNQGPIDSWSLDGSLLKFQAGVSVFDGTVIDGIMTLDFGDGLFLVLRRRGRILRRLRTRPCHSRLLSIWCSERQRASIPCLPWVTAVR